MISRSATILTLIAGASLAFSAAALAAPPAKTVVIGGCPTMGNPAVCTEMGAGGTTYNITGAVPPAPIGKYIILRGTESQAHSFCRGIVLQNIRWRETKRACPMPKMM
jgi:type IV secretory pathway TrbL component